MNITYFKLEKNQQKFQIKLLNNLKTKLENNFSLLQILFRQPQDLINKLHYLLKSEIKN